MTVKNTPAYYNTVKITAMKSFTAHAHGAATSGRITIVQNIIFVDNKTNLAFYFLEKYLRLYRHKRNSVLFHFVTHQLKQANSKCHLIKIKK